METALLTTNVRQPMRKGQPFEVVRDKAETRAGLNLPDVVIPLLSLHFTEEGLIETPGLGTLALTDWSRGQLARMLGIRWSRWFDNQLVSPQERKEEIERRLSRQTGEWKIRARRYAQGEDGTGEGMLRAFVGVGYAPMDDAQVFDRLERTWGHRTEEFSFIRVDLTDRSSYYAVITQVDLELGLKTSDIHRNGFLIANSEVGFSALSILEYLWRLVCTNGLIVWSAGKKLFRRIHRQTSEESLDAGMTSALALMPERWSASARALTRAKEMIIPNPEEALVNFFHEKPERRPYTEMVKAAYQAEPDPTRFGLIQAITRAAQGFAPDTRFLLERAAGNLLMQPTRLEVH